MKFNAIFSLWNFVLYFHMVTPFDLTLILALVSYLHGIFIIPSEASWHSFGLQLSLVWSQQPIRHRVSSDLWPGLDPTFKLSIPSWGLSIAASRFSIRLFVWMLDMGVYAPPPPYSMESGWRPWYHAGSWDRGMMNKSQRLNKECLRFTRYHPILWHH